MDARSASVVRPIARAQLHLSRGRDPRRVNRSNQRGAVAVISSLVIVGLIGFCGLALDTALVYNRQSELRNVSNAAALAAARKLNGTAAGVNAAVAAAGVMAEAQQYQYGSSTISWTPSAITFSTSPDRNGTWVSAATAAASPERMMYVRVDTTEMSGSGDIPTIFMPVLDADLATVTTHSVAIAGRTMIDAMPLAICAMSVTPAEPRANGNASPATAELVQYGFRRGVSYDLMKLNPDGATPANFLINPQAAPGQPGSSSDLAIDKVGPYVCKGTLGFPRLSGDSIAVSTGFPLASLYKQLNSRFDQYDDNLCNFNGAPPDANVQSYVASNMPAVFPWMNVAPAGQTAAEAPPQAVARLQTIADLPHPGGNAAQYGPVWAYAKAVKFSSYVPGIAEPTAGYTPFATSDWSAMYGTQSAKATYPASTPYKAAIGINFLAPSLLHKPGIRGRRVLNVPLLSCSSVSGGSATVLAVGKFFMTIPATQTAIPAEFAGAIPLQNVQSYVELF
jgi:Flp pilus assembly protein TadG